MKHRHNASIIFFIIAAIMMPLGILGSIYVFRGINRVQPTITVLRLRLKWLHQGQFAGFYAADKLGYFHDEGIKVEILPGGQTHNAIIGVTSGADHVGIAGAEPLLLARSQKMKVVAIGVVYQDTAACFLTRANDGIKTFKDFEGKVVGTQNGTDMQYLYEGIASISKLDRTKVKEVNVGFNVARFLTGDIDVFPGYVVNEPWEAQEKGVDLSVISPRDYGLRLYGDTLFVAEEFLHQNQATIKAFLRATERGWDYALNNPEEAAKLCNEYSNSPGPDHNRDMIERSRLLIRPTGERMLRMTDERWLEMHRFLKTYGPLKNDVSVKDIYTNAYLPE